MSAKSKWAHAHAEAAELAAEVRREPLDQTARVASLEKRRRKQDEPARRAYANQALALRFFVQFCGYAPSVKETLNTAIEAAAGLDHPITRLDWEMGLYLRGGTEQEAARIRALPAHHTEKRTLAKAWTRAFEEYEAEEKRTGIVALRRIPGSKDFKTGQKRASQIHALCAQDIAEIATAAHKVQGKRFERFARAAQAHVELLRDNPARRPVEAGEKQEKPKRIEQPETSALAVVRFLNKLEKMTDALILNLPLEMQAEVRQHAEALLRQKLAAELDPDETPDRDPEALPEADPVDLLSSKERSTNSAEITPVENIQNVRTEDTKPAKNAGSDDGLVYNLYTNVPHTCPSPAVEPELIEERVFIMCEAGDVSETEAAQIARRDLCETCNEAANSNPVAEILHIGPPERTKSVLHDVAQNGGHLAAHPSTSLRDQSSSSDGARESI
jgi:hypothetical protein